MSIKIIGENKYTRNIKESFDFDNFKSKAYKIKEEITDLTMDLEDLIEEDHYDKKDGVQGPLNLSPGIAEKIYYELQDINSICESTMKSLSSEYRF